MYKQKSLLNNVKNVSTSIIKHKIAAIKPYAKLAENTNKQITPAHKMYAVKIVKTPQDTKMTLPIFQTQNIVPCTRYKWNDLKNKLNTLLRVVIHSFLFINLITTNEYTHY